MPLYGIDRLSGSSTVIVVEGEKAADALLSIGVQAVGTVCGANTIPSPGVLAELTGRHVRCWPDNDAVGMAHMEMVARGLEGAASVGIVDWADAPNAGDAADFVATGGDAESVFALPTHSAPQGDESWAESISASQAHSPSVSARITTQRGAARKLPFRSALEFAGSTPAEITWIARPYVAAGSICEVVGRIKTAGKTTMVMGLCRAVLEGADFLGEPTKRMAVVYLTEQPASSLRESLRRADLLDRADFHLLSWSDTASVSWPALVASTVAECRRVGAGLFVVDTLSRFAGIRGDGENNAGEADAIMGPLQLAAADGMSIIIVRHERKAGGDVGDAGRGSSAFGGAVDVVLAVRRLEGNGPANRRVIQALSRFDETPETLVVELTPNGYVSLGNEPAVAHHAAKARVLETVAAAGAAGLSVAELVKRTAHSRTTIQGALDELIAERRVARIGGGVRGQPFQFTIVDPRDLRKAAGDEPANNRQTLAGVEQLAELFRNLGPEIDRLGDLP